MKPFLYRQSGSDQERKPLIKSPTSGTRHSYSTLQNEGAEAIAKGEERISQTANALIDKECKFSQHVAALAATLGVLVTGITMGWSAPVLFKITKPNSTDYDFDISPSESVWISSILNLGASIACFPSGLIIDKIGRKTTMLLLVLPLTLGWLLITFGTNVGMLIAGRFITGTAAGAICVTVPAYTSEIAQDSIRGNLGSYFQFMVALGILFGFAFGSYAPVFVFNILCTFTPIIFGLIFFFMPESPIFLLAKGKIDEAKKALIWLRSSDHDVDYELSYLKFIAEKDHANRTSYLATLKKKTTIKPLLFCFSLIFFQQLSGINAVSFNSSQIFYDAGVTIPSEIATITLGVTQVVFSFVSGLVVDILGRRILLMFSTLTICFCTFFLGIYFFLLKTYGYEASVVQALTWLPLVSLCVFIIAFAMGLGPIPWITIGELCSIEVRSFVSAATGTFNWLLAFAVTSSFKPLSAAIGMDLVYWIFAGSMITGFLFVAFLIPETKGKSIEEIQVMLRSSAPKPQVL